jgi:hypothetical protein
VRRGRIKMINWIIAGVWIGFVIAYVTYHIGYVRGYKAGLAYGMEKLEDYHQHTLTNLRGLGK